jgi:hypothetical protein
LYALARKYNTTVTRLLQLNPNVEVYNLQIGSGLTICPGEDYKPEIPTPITPEFPPCPTPITPEFPPYYPENPTPITPTVPPLADLNTRELLRELVILLNRFLNRV